MEEYLYVVLGPQRDDRPEVFDSYEAAVAYGRRLAKSRCVVPEDYAEETTLASVLPSRDAVFVYSDDNRVRLWSVTINRG